MGRTVVRALLVPLSLAALIACEPGTTAPTSSDGGPGPTLTGQVPPGSYVYDDLGVEAVLTLDGGRGTLEVANGTGGTLDPASPYVLAADDGRRVPIDVSDVTPIDDGVTTTFEVRLATETPIGLAVLVFGDDEYGAMVPAAAG